MKIFKLFYVLYKMKMLSPFAIFRLGASIKKYGINLMTLLSFASSTYGNRIALVEDNETLTYREFFEEVKKLSLLIKESYSLKKGTRVGVLCRNHAAMVRSLFAVSLTGADIFFLNVEMNNEQFKKLLEKYSFELLIYDSDLTSMVDNSNYSNARLFSYHDKLPSINSFLHTDISGIGEVQRTNSGKVVLLTSGTTGNYKIAVHKPSLFNYLNPFVAVLTRLRLSNCNTAYIATPIYHGYGFAILLLFFALGKKVVITKRFNAEKACSLIHDNGVEVMIAVPLMINKLLKYNTENFRSLSCVVSGGVELNPKLVQATFNKWGNVLYNLYGTSEAGLNIIATPEDLKYATNTIGRKIKEVKLRILDDDKREVKIGKIGQFCIRNKWSMTNSTSYIETGDLGYRDEKGYYFLCGRVDDMVVSSGENVYPIEVEEIIKKHPQVEDAAVVGVKNELFGQRLRVYVLRASDSYTTKEELLCWLNSRLARFQMPEDIIFVERLPYTNLGKLDKKQLSEYTPNVKAQEVQ